MDYAFAPGPTAYDLALKNMLSHRDTTTLIDVPFVTTIRNLVTQLGSKVPPNPLTHVVIGSHGDDNAYMKIQLNGAFGEHTTYEDMVQEMTAATRHCQFPDNVVNPRPKDSSNNPIPCFVFIKGCLIGKSPVFLKKLKDVFNGLSSTPIQVAAPRFYHSILPVAQGTLELFCYHFEHYSKTKVKDKAALEALMAAKGFKDIHGTAIPAANWKRWIPANIHSKQKDLQQVKLNPTPIKGKTGAKVGRYKYEAVTIITFTVRISSGSLPTTSVDRLALLRTQMQTVAANPGTNLLAQSLVATHVFPYFKRYDYTSLNDMIDNLDWSYNPQDAQTMLCIGKRHQYNVNPPLVSATNNELIFNYYANNTKTTSSRMFADNDARFLKLLNPAIWHQKQIH